MCMHGHAQNNLRAMSVACITMTLLSLLFNCDERMQCAAEGSSSELLLQKMHYTSHCTFIPRVFTLSFPFLEFFVMFESSVDLYPGLSYDSGLQQGVLYDEHFILKKWLKCYLHLSKE